MERPGSHITGDSAEALFTSALPAEWVVRPQPKDYGIDVEVEVFDGQKSTGIIFKVQLKGTEKIEYNKTGQHIRFSIGVTHLEYYLEQLKIPVFLVLCDVTEKSLYWLEMQSNDGLIEAYENVKKKNKEKGQNQKTITLHIPAANRLPGPEAGQEAMLAAYEAMMARISAGWAARSQTAVDIETTGLPSTGLLFMGRERELRLLDNAWAGEDTAVVILRAPGGVGKSALVNH
ncbi:MAG: DUF4365 domain-containing protein [bacterium]|nr:DUF4365 domain-containing protein [bacterium]